MTKNVNEIILPSAVRAATNSVDIINRRHSGLLLVLEVTANPGAQTLEPKWDVINPLTGLPSTVAFWVAPTVGGNGITSYGLGLGMTGAVEGISDGSILLPFHGRLTITHSAGGDWTYSLSAQWLI